MFVSAIAWLINAWWLEWFGFLNYEFEVVVLALQDIGGLISEAFW